MGPNRGHQKGTYHGRPESERRAGAAGGLLKYSVNHSLFFNKLGIRLALDKVFNFGEKDIRMMFFRIGGVTLEVIENYDIKYLSYLFSISLNFSCSSIGLFFFEILGHIAENLSLIHI